jgi:aquaporin Z
MAVVELRREEVMPDADRTGRAGHLTRAIEAHWPEYLIEGALLGLFMVSACLFTALLEHPASPVRQVIADGFTRRALMGLAMGATAVTLIYSAWGKRSGAHFNPATTLTFWRLGKVESSDAVLYVLAQFAGGAAGVFLVARALPGPVSDPSVNYAATQPGSAGLAAAFAAEVGMTFLLMSVVLAVSNRPRWNRWTGLAAGACVALFITFEAPISGMSLNPARTLASALGARTFDALWIYFVAPPVGMLLAAEARRRFSGVASVLCAKYHHENSERCIFRCRYGHCGPPAASRQEAP